MKHRASSLLASLPLTYKPGESKGTTLFGNRSCQMIANTQKRASDLIFPAGYALHKDSSKHLSSPFLASPRSVVTHLHFNGGL